MAAMLALAAAPLAAKAADVVISAKPAPAVMAAKPAPRDPDTAAWWQLIGTLSSDAMRGRDTGSADHARAASLVADAFKAAGLQPAGDKGGWLQDVPINAVRVEKPGTAFSIVAPDGRRTNLRFLHDISIRAGAGLPRNFAAAIAFRGYCGAGDVGDDVRGKIMLCFAGRRAGMPNGAVREAAASAHGAAGIIAIDDIGFTIEPPRWPDAYARSLALGAAPATAAPQLAIMRLNAAALPLLLAGSGHDARAILAAAVAARPLPSFDLAVRFEAQLAISQRDLHSPNILALLPGTDPALAGAPLVVSAHLDGYGIGEPVDGDAIYNGAFDDAAYVATLVQLAKRRQGRGFARPLLFAVFTGEEKGLLGAKHWVAHPTIAARPVADINLDAIRPLFPLKILTLIGLDRSNLVDHVRAVAGPMGVEVRPDLEPERGMIGRTDAAPFLAAGIPGVSFMFGYDSGSDAEARFRLWYRTRYHKPADDIGQPIDFKAAADFNRFFYALTERVANASDAPRLTPAAR
jgi:predicted GNAT superfamily acetyltransferase